jgi:hypothetical protein
VQVYLSIWRKTQYDITDQNNNVSSEGLDRHFLKYPNSSYRTDCDISDTVCLDLQNFRYSIYHSLTPVYNLSKHTVRIVKCWFVRRFRLFNDFRLLIFTHVTWLGCVIFWLWTDFFTAFFSSVLNSPALRQLRSSLQAIERDRHSFKGESGSSVATESSSGSEQDAIHGKACVQAQLKRNLILFCYWHK